MRKKRDLDMCAHVPNRGLTNNDHDGIHQLQPKWRPASKNRTGAFAQNKAANYYMHAQMHNPEHTLLLLGGHALGRDGCRPCYCFADAVAAAAPAAAASRSAVAQAASSDHRPGVTADADRSRAFQSITSDASFHGADQGAKASATYTALYAKFTSDVWARLSAIRQNGHGAIYKQPANKRVYADSSNIGNFAAHINHRVM